MTPEQFEKRLIRLERKLCCITNPPVPTCPIEPGPCTYTSEGWTDQTGGILYSIFMEYIDLGGTITTQLLSWTSNIGQTPQQFLDDLNAVYSPNMVFTYDDDTDIVSVVASDFAAACYLNLSLSQSVPNTTTDWQSPNSVDFTGLQTYDGSNNNQGSFDGAPWGGNSGPATSIGYLFFDSNTDKLTITYNAAIPSGVSVCVHLIQGGLEVTGSPFNVNIPGAGIGSVDITGLTGALDAGQDLEILVDNAC